MSDLLGQSYRILMASAFMARSGFFCAHPLAERLGISWNMLRVSLYIYNTEEEVRQFLTAMQTIMRRMN